MKDINFDKSNTVFILHLNIASLQKHFDELHELLSLIPHKPDILCITETRIADVPLINISIPGYKFFHRNSATVIGGVGIYINDSLKFEIHDDFNLDIAGVEEIWIEFTGSGFPKDTKRVLGCIYRHPSQKTERFLDKLNDRLLQLNSISKQYCIIGDMNINILCNNHQIGIAKKYNLILNSNGCHSAITTATRVTNHSKTLLDHVLTNEQTLEVTPGVIDFQISDHCLTFAMLKNSNDIMPKRPLKDTKTFQVCCFRDFESYKFCEDLKKTLELHFNCFSEINSDNLNAEFNKFNECILNVINKHAPMQKASRKQKRLLMKPWITKELIDTIRRKQKLYKTHFKSGDPSKIAYYKKFSNDLTRKKESCKKKFFLMN